MARRVTFSEDGARRIVNAVRGYERGNRDQPPIKFRQPGDDGGGSQIRLGTIDLTWTKGNTATVTRINGDGTPYNPLTTFTAKNWFATVEVTSCDKKVACAEVGGTWILIAAECD